MFENPNRSGVFPWKSWNPGRQVIPSGEEAKVWVTKNYLRRNGVYNIMILWNLDGVPKYEQNTVHSSTFMSEIANKTMPIEYVR